MPTTREEVLYIASILDEHLYDSYETKGVLTKDLAEKVGFATSNYSVRKSLFKLCQHYNPNWKIPDILVTSLIDRWRSDNSLRDITLHDFVGMDAEEFELYCEGKYYSLKDTK